MREISNLQADNKQLNYGCLLISGWLRGSLGWYPTIDPCGAQHMETMVTYLEGDLPMDSGEGSISIPAPGIGSLNVFISGRDALVSIIQDARADDWDPEIEDILSIKDGSVIVYRKEWVSHVDRALRVMNTWANVFKMTRRFSVHWEWASQYAPMDIL